MKAALLALMLLLPTLGHAATAEEIFAVYALGDYEQAAKLGEASHTAQGLAIAARAVEGIEAGADSSLAQLVGGDLSKVTAQTVYDAAQQGDDYALEVVRETAKLLGAGVANLVSYNYRRMPAITLAKQLIDEGRLGRIFHYSAKFLQDWTISKDLPQGGPGLWRLDVKVAGSGVTGDLLAHCIDTALWLNGSIEKVNAMTETFVKQRQHTETGKVEKVGIDDACAFLARFKNGSLATFESTRYARGHKALYTFEINGEHASIAWDLHDLHRLQYFDHRDEGRIRGWRNIHVTDGDHHYMDKWWVPGLQIGYEHSFIHQLADFLDGLAGKKPAGPTFRDALETQYVCDAVLKSAKSNRWEKVATVK